MRRRARLPEPAPLSMFPADMRAEIERLVALPTPPPKWLLLGPPDEPRPLAAIVSRAWFEWHRARGRDPRNEREPISPGRRALVIERDGLVCHLCGGVVERTDVHLDHVIPWSKGGPDTAENLRVAHSRCNIKKGNRT